MSDLSSQAALRPDSLVNPYAATVFTEPAEATPEEATRKKYLTHEASIQGIGALYMLGGVGMFIFGAVGSVGAVGGLASGNAEEAGMLLILTMFYFLIGPVQFVVGLKLRSFQSWARIVAIIFSAVGLLAIPIGTIVSLYFLYLLAGSKGQHVFSPEYQRIRAATPHIRYRTSMVVWVLLGFLVVSLIGIIIVLLFS